MFHLIPTRNCNYTQRWVYRDGTIDKQSLYDSISQFWNKWMANPSVKELHASWKVAARQKRRANINGIINQSVAENEDLESR